MTIHHDESSLPAPENNAEDREMLIKFAESLQDITERIPEFVYSEEEGEVNCEVCGTKFKYSSDLQQDCTTTKLNRKFINLKKSLRRHCVESSKHQEELKKASAKAMIWEKEENRNKAVGLRLGRWNYYLLRMGRPDTDYTTLIYINKKNGGDIGDINHSFNFVPKFLVSLSAAVQNRIHTHLSTRLLATGCLPPVNVLLDKFTHQHVTRQLVGVTTIVPDSPNLIQALYLGAPRCPRGTGDFMTENATGVLDKVIVGRSIYGHDW